MNAQVLGDRSKTVRGIEVCVALRVWEAAPQPLVAILEQNLAQVVQIRGLRVQQRAKHTLTHHLQHRELAVAVATVLHHQAVTSRFFGCVDQLPAIFDRRRDRDFAPHVLARAHRRQRYRRVPAPRRRGVDEIDIVALHQSLEIPLAIRVQRGCGLTGLDHHRRRALRLFFDDVGECDNAHTFHGQKLSKHRTSTQSRAHDRNAHDLSLLERNAEHSLGICGRWRRKIHSPIVSRGQQLGRRRYDCRCRQRRSTAKQFAP